MIHVHVGDDDVRHGREIDADGLQPRGELAGAREARELRAHPGVDEDGLVAAAHDEHVQRPVEFIGRQEHVIEPVRQVGRIGVRGHRRGGQRQHAVADHHHVNVADLQRVTGRHQFFGPVAGGAQWGVYGKHHGLLSITCANLHNVLFLPRAVLLTVLVPDRRHFPASRQRQAGGSATRCHLARLG